MACTAFITAPPMTVGAVSRLPLPHSAAKAAARQ